MDKTLFNSATVNFYYSGFDEQAIYNEIFNSQTYKLNTTAPCIVMDIGMNIGLASLYFATLANVEKIYSYEPFQHTYNCALENLDLNPNLKSKIIPHSYGISNENNLVTGTFDPNYKGNSSIINGISPTGSAVNVEVREAGTELQRIITENPNILIVLKIDCEGGEVNIFKDSKFISLLPQINEIVMETHRADEFLNISSILTNTGFSITNRMISASNGYIHAYR